MGVREGVSAKGRTSVTPTRTEGAKSCPAMVANQQRSSEKDSKSYKEVDGTCDAATALKVGAISQPGKRPTFDPSAYASKRKEQLRRAKEIKDGRHSSLGRDHNRGSQAKTPEKHPVVAISDGARVSGSSRSSEISTVAASSSAGPSGSSLDCIRIGITESEAETKDPSGTVVSSPAQIQVERGSSDNVDTGHLRESISHSSPNRSEETGARGKKHEASMEMHPVAGEVLEGPRSSGGQDSLRKSLSNGEEILDFLSERCSSPEKLSRVAPSGSTRSSSSSAGAFGNECSAATARGGAFIMAEGAIPVLQEFGSLAVTTVVATSALGFVTSRLPSSAMKAGAAEKARILGSGTREKERVPIQANLSRTGSVRSGHLGEGNLPASGSTSVKVVAGVGKRARPASPQPRLTHSAAQPSTGATKEPNAGMRQAQAGALTGGTHHKAAGSRAGEAKELQPKVDPKMIRSEIAPIKGKAGMPAKSSPSVRRAGGNQGGGPGGHTRTGANNTLRASASAAAPTRQATPESHQPQAVSQGAGPTCYKEPLSGDAQVVGSSEVVRRSAGCTGEGTGQAESLLWSQPLEVQSAAPPPSGGSSWQGPAPEHSSSPDMLPAVVPATVHAVPDTGTVPQQAGAAARSPSPLRGMARGLAAAFSGRCLRRSSSSSSSSSGRGSRLPRRNHSSSDDEQAEPEARVPGSHAESVVEATEGSRLGGVALEVVRKSKGSEGATEERETEQDARNPVPRRFFAGAVGLARAGMGAAVSPVPQGGSCKSEQEEQQLRQQQEGEAEEQKEQLPQHRVQEQEFSSPAVQGSAAAPAGVGGGGEDAAAALGEAKRHPCPHCHRSFRSEVLSKHANVCRKVFLSRRKEFDSKAARLEGTEAAAFVKRAPRASGKASTRSKAGGRSGSPVRAGSTTAELGEEVRRGPRKGPSTLLSPSGAAMQTSVGDGVRGSSSAPLASKPVPKWKRQSEEFQAVVRAARAMKAAQAAAAKGETVVLLLPTPPTDHSDYVQCPSCERRFAPETAERHIPKCSSILAKPKPLVRRKASQGLPSRAGSPLGKSSESA